MTAVVEPAKLPRRVGRYVMYGPIASGGMATVHFGRLQGDGGFGRIVAIKRLREQFAGSSEVLASLVDEARLVSRIQHPNVVPCLDIVSADGEIFLIMEYVAGESLSRIVASSGAATPTDVACSIVGGVLLGLQAAHDATSEQGEPLGIVHRDVSPQNILVARDGHPRLLDFGVAKARNRLSAATDSGIIKGKLAYMSPEQVGNVTVDHRTDIFAVGVVLWELLSGHRLFQASNEAATIMKVATGVIPSVTMVNPQLSSELGAVVHKALARDPMERFQSAREFALELERVQSFASAAKVSAWLDGVMAASLQARAGAVAEIERAASPPQITSQELGQEGTAGNLTGPARRVGDGRGTTWSFALFAVGLAGVAALLLWVAADRWVRTPKLAAALVAPRSLISPTQPVRVRSAEAGDDAPSASTAAPLVDEREIEIVTAPTPKTYPVFTARPTASASADEPATCERVLGPDGIWRLSPPGCSR